jgi:dTDP-4-amino-4,6-dideoxygalactose transaminase
LVSDLPSCDEILPYLRRIDSSRRYTNFGPLVCELECALANLAGGAAPSYAVAVSSGTAAIELAIAALGLPVGAQVLLPAFTFPATAVAVLRAGHHVVLSDVDSADWVLTPAIARQAIRDRRIDLFLPVSAFGFPQPAADWDRLTEETGIPVVIDGAGALGYQELGRTTHLAVSLHATKPLGIGEGGAILTRAAEFAERARRLSNFGFRAARVETLGFNAKMSEYAAAVGLAQLNRWPALRTLRERIWSDYRCALADLNGVRWQRPDLRWAPSVAVVTTPAAADRVADRLAAVDIETRRWYLPPLYGHPALGQCARAGEEAMPVTEHLSRHALGLPFHTSLSSTAMARVMAGLRQALGSEGEP